MTPRHGAILRPPYFDAADSAVGVAYHSTATMVAPVVRQAFLAGLLLLTAASELPTPPLQTASQHALMQRISARAKAGSADATDKAIALFASEATTEIIRECCPELHGQTGLQLLQRFLAEVAVTELTHNINADGSGWEDDVSLSLLERAPAFYNLWQLSQQSA